MRLGVAGRPSRATRLSSHGNFPPFYRFIAFLLPWCSTQGDAVEAELGTERGASGARRDAAHGHCS